METGIMDASDVTTAVDLQAADVAKQGKKRKKSRWPMKRLYREAMVKRLAMVAIDRNSEPAAACNAAKIVLAAEAQNQKDDHRPGADLNDEIAVFVDRGWYGNEVKLLAAEARVAEAKAAEKAKGEEGKSG
jgi:hypothetical protein